MKLAQIVHRIRSKLNGNGTSLDTTFKTQYEEIKMTTNPEIYVACLVVSKLEALSYTVQSELGFKVEL